jgi:preprotein translocase SecE subunit
MGRPQKEACLLSDYEAEKVLLKAAEKEAVLFPQIIGFLRNVKQEMKLVNRPSWRGVRSTTVVVVVFVFLFAFYLRALDGIFSALDRWFFSH